MVSLGNLLNQCVTYLVQFSLPAFSGILEKSFHLSFDL